MPLCRTLFSVFDSVFYHGISYFDHQMEEKTDADFIGGSDGSDCLPAVFRFRLGEEQLQDQFGYRGLL